MGNLGSLYVQSKRKETICPVVSVPHPQNAGGRPPAKARPAGCSRTAI